MKSLEQVVEESLLRAVDIQLDFLAHESLWGVPCGPTLSMVNPPKLVGIRSTRGRR